MDQDSLPDETAELMRSVPTYATIQHAREAKDAANERMRAGAREDALAGYEAAILLLAPQDLARLIARLRGPGEDDPPTPALRETLPVSADDARHVHLAAHLIAVCHANRATCFYRAALEVPDGTGASQPGPDTSADTGSTGALGALERLRHLTDPAHALPEERRALLQQADEAASLAVEWDPQYTLAYVKRMHILQCLRRYQDAVKDADTVLAIAPEHTGARRSRAQLQRLLAAQQDQAKDAIVSGLKSVGASLLSRIGIDINDFSTVTGPDGQMSIQYQPPGSPAVPGQPHPSDTPDA